MEGRETAGALRVQLAAAQDHRDQARTTLSDARAELERQRAENRAQGEQLERLAKQLSDARGAIDHLTGECTNAQRMLAAAEVERDQALAELDIKRAALSSMNELQGQRDRAVGQSDALSQRLDDALSRRTQAEDALAAARAELDRMTQRLSNPPEDLTGLDPDAAAAIAARTAERDALADTVHRLDGLYAEAVQAKADAQAKVTELNRALEAERIDHAACRATLTAVLQERNHLRALRQSSAPPAAPDPAAEARALVQNMGEAPAEDDLQALKGIGAKTAKRLTGLGIVSFEQIARLEPAAVEVIAKAVGLSPERVLREDWPGQARAQLV
jgi:predicted flap endonuclease-1-like 5' DNA nuclease